jgi:hypothetical protein
MLVAGRELVLSYVRHRTVAGKVRTGEARSRQQAAVKDDTMDTLKGTDQRAARGRGMRRRLTMHQHGAVHGPVASAWRRACGPRGVRTHQRAGVS